MNAAYTANITTLSHRGEKPRAIPCDICRRRPAVRRVWNSANCTTANVCRQCGEGSR